MTKFPLVESRFIRLPAANIDTDAMVPARFLLALDRRGFGQYLFADERAGDAAHPMNGPNAHAACILLCGPNFGCGSSREHAVWALHDFGIRVVIAPSFGEIFALNCFKNSILPITLRPECIETLAELPESATLRVDLEIKTIVLPHGTTIPIDIDDAKRLALLEGLDEIAQIDHYRSLIDAFEERQAALRPWLASIPALTAIRRSSRVS
jgi:3-isopropylmalate/(R)-2-methylmalate dehydratase small subunit